MGDRFSRKLRRRKSKGSNRDQALRNRSLPAVEILEVRRLLTTDLWINPAGGSWQVASNWSENQVPGPSDDVMIDVSGNPTITYNDSSTIHSLVDEDSLDIFGGSLTITAGASRVTGTLTVEDGASLAIDGPGATFVDGTSTSIDGANLYTYAGASMTLSAVDSLAGPSNGSATIQANGTNGSGTPSTIDLSHVTSLAGATNGNVLFLYALSGGSLLLPNAPADNSGRTYFLSDGVNSLLDISKIPTLTADANNPSSLQATNGGIVLDPALTTVIGSYLTTDAASTIATAQITSITSSQVQANSGTPSYAGLSTINGDTIYAYGGADLAFPGVTSLAGASGYSTTVQADGTDGSGTPSTIDLSQITSLSGATNGNVLFLYALSGGHLLLPNAPADNTGRTYFLSDGGSDGVNSLLDISKIPTLTADANNPSSLQATNGGIVLDPALTTVIGSYLTTDAASTIATAQITSITSSQVQANSGTPSYAGLSTINGDTIYAYGGADLAFPGVTSLSGASGYSTTVQAYGTDGSGTPSTIDLSQVTSLSGAANGNILFLYALSGGTLLLPNAIGQTTGRVYFESNGTGSVLDITDLTSIIDDQGGNSSLNVTSGGIVIDTNLSTYSNVSVTTDPSVSITDQPGQTFSFPNGTTTFSTGTVVDQGDMQLGRAEVFTLADYPGGGTGIIQSPGTPSSFDISVDIADPTTVFTLINSAYGEDGDTVGSVEFKATGGLDYTVDLVEGQNIRDHNIDGFENSIGQGALGSTYVGTAYYGYGQVRLDEQEFVLPASFASATLTDIILNGAGNYPSGQPFLAAATVASESGMDPVALPSSLINANLQTYANGGNYPLGGSLVSAGNALVAISGGLTINGQGGLSVSSTSTLEISGDLLGNTTNASAFNPVGTVELTSGSGTSNPPQLLEAMSEDLGDTAAGFDQNFAYGTLILTANTHVELVDLAANSPGDAPEALYVNDLIILSGATLNLDGLKLYVHAESNDGTIVNGGAIVSGEVFDDANGNGSLDSGEPGLVGFLVDLTNTATSSTYAALTNASGQFSLTGIAAGTYTLSEVLPLGFVETLPASPGTYTITVDSGQTVTGEDFGDHPTASISGEVFNDLNGDGTLETGEPGLSGSTVNLLNSSSQVIADATTGSGGSYSFASLLPGTYTVQVVARVGVRRLVDGQRRRHRH